MQKEEILEIHPACMRVLFEEMDFDSIAVAPYMGSDSVKPF